MFEYLASVQSAVRRFNDRMMNISKNLGKDSSIIEDITAKLDVLFPGNYRFKDGVPQLVRPAEIYKDADMSAELYNLDKEVPTWGEIRKSFESQYEAYAEQEKFFKQEPVSIQRFIKTMQSLPEAITIASEQDVTDALAILREKGRRKTYAELENVVRIVGDAV